MKEDIKVFHESLSPGFTRLSQLLILVPAVLMPIFGLIHRAILPHEWESIPLRLLVTVFGFGSLYLSIRSQYWKERVLLLLELTLFLTFAVIVIIIDKNPMAPSVAWGFTITVLMIGVFFFSLWSRVVYAALVIGYCLYRRDFENAGIPQSFFVTLNSTLVIFMVIEGYSKHKYVSGMRRQFILRQQAERNATVSARLVALGEMAGGIAHEINNPLTIISTNAFLLSKGLEKAGDSRSAHLAAVILETTDRIAGIIKALRNVARDASNDPFEKQSLNALLRDVLSLCEKRYIYRGVSVTVEYFEPDVELEVRGAEISQVIVNLLNNAFEAVENGPDKWIRVRGLQNPTEVEIHIEDGGRKIPEEIAHKLMQPFFTTKPVGSGTGLGLSVSKGLIEAHGGQLFLDRSAQNTRFVVRLPRTVVSAK